MDAPFVIDIEASGLGRGSYPIEVGFVTPEEKTFCTLIKPIDEWTHWDHSAEALHLISQDLLNEHGKTIQAVAEWLNSNLENKIVYSDGWANDMCWLGQLFDSAGIAQSFRIESILTLLNEDERDQWSKVHRAVVASTSLLRHRASSDALIIQKTFRIIKDASKSGSCPVSQINIS